MNFNLAKSAILLTAVTYLIGCNGSSSEGEDTALQPQALQYSAAGFNSLAFDSQPECEADTPDVFFTVENSFSIDNAYVLIQTAWLTEQEIPVAQAQFSKWGFKDSKLFDMPEIGARAYVAEHEGFVLVTFRGTTTPAEFVSNAVFVPAEVSEYHNTTSDKPSMSHGGILSAHRIVRSEVHQLMLDANALHKPVIFAGHSRGGALSTLQAAYFASQGGNISAIYTFAQPRSSNSSLRESLENTFGDRYYRMDYEFDVTPQVPPSAEMAAPLHQAGYIPTFMLDLVETIDYDYDPGYSYVLSDDGALMLDTDMHATQLAYWEHLFTTYPLFSTIPELIVSAPQLVEYFPNNHHTSVYICALSAHFRL